MKPVSYSKLHDIVNSIERLIVDHGIQTFPSYPFLRSCAQSRVQGFGLDDSTRGQDLPVVVAIGGNYTQGSAVVPRDLNNPQSWVEDDLKTWRGYLNNGLDHYSADPQRWEENCAASSAKINIPPDKEYHFLMTNFCLWITQNSWQNMGAAVRADLLEKNPLLGGNKTCPGEWAHLTNLAQSLKDEKANVIWVAHGIHSEVFALFRQFIRSVDNPRWLLLPNLSYPYRYKLWSLLNCLRKPGALKI